MKKPDIQPFLNASIDLNRQLLYLDEKQLLDVLFWANQIRTMARKEAQLRAQLADARARDRRV
jgi:hypothetical protein